MRNETNSKRIQESMVQDSEIKTILFAGNDNTTVSICNSKENAYRTNGYGYGFFAE